MRSLKNPTGGFFCHPSKSKWEVPRNIPTTWLNFYTPCKSQPTSLPYYQWARGRIFCTQSSPVHMTFTFMAKRSARTYFFNIITHGQFIFLHCYFVCRKIDASSIIIRHLKTAPARAFIFSGNVVGFQRQRRWFSACDVRVTMQITSQFQYFA